MLNSAIWSLFLILFITFCLIKKRLQLFEIIFLWLMVWLITHSTSTIIMENLGYLGVSTKPEHFSLHLFMRIIIYPIIITLTIDVQCRVKLFMKVIIIISSIIILSLIEFLGIWKGVFINKDWKFWYSIIEWSFTVLLTYLAWLWYRKLLRKEDLHIC